MVKKEYKIVGKVDGFLQLRRSLQYQGIKFKTRVPRFESGEVPFIFISLNISPDMVQEVEDLIMEIAKKSGVKVE